MEGLTGDINDENIAENIIDEINTIVDDQDPGMYNIISCSVPNSRHFSS